MHEHQAPSKATRPRSSRSSICTDSRSMPTSGSCSIRSSPKMSSPSSDRPAPSGSACRRSSRHSPTSTSSSTTTSTPCSGQLVRVDGDKANAFSYGIWVLVRNAAGDDPSWTGTGWYDDELVRTRSTAGGSSTRLPAGLVDGQSGGVLARARPQPGHGARTCCANTRRMAGHATSRARSGKVVHRPPRRWVSSAAWNPGR